MTLSKTEFVFFGVVHEPTSSLDTGPGMLVAVQCAAIDVNWSNGTPTGPDWTVSQVKENLANAGETNVASAFWAAATTGLPMAGQLAVRQDIDTLAADVRDAMLDHWKNNRTLQGELLVPGMGTQAITIHLRCLPTIDFLLVASDQFTAPLGSGDSEAPLQITPGSPGIYPITSWPVDDPDAWFDPGTGDSGTLKRTAPMSGSGITIEEFDFAFQGAMTDTNPFMPEHQAQFDGTDYTIGDGAALHTVETGDSQPQMILDKVAPTLELTATGGAPLAGKVYVPSSVTSESVDLVVHAQDDYYIDSNSIVVTVTLTGREVPTPTVATYTFSINAGSWSWNTPGCPLAFTVTPDPVKHFKDLYLQGTLTVSGQWESIAIQIDAEDLSSNSATITRQIAVAIPTDIALLLDYTGSMAAEDAPGHSKWQSAQEAANMFNAIYGALKPTVDDRVISILFHTQGGGSTVEYNGNAGSINPLVNIPSDPPGNYLTPLGEPVIMAQDEFPPLAAGRWRKRAMVLLTDGIETASPKLYDGADNAASVVTSVLADERVGSTVNVCAFGDNYAVDTSIIAPFATDYGGMFHQTGAWDAAADALALKQEFLSLLVDTLPVELAGGNLLSGQVVAISEGDERVVFGITREEAFTLDLDGAPYSGAYTVTQQQGFSWTVITAPPTGNWSINFTDASGDRGFAVVDLALRTQCAAQQQTIGSGRPVQLRVAVTDNGAPVSGSQVVVRVNGPGHSIGELLRRYVRVTCRRTITINNQQRVMYKLPLPKNKLLRYRHLPLRNKLALAAIDWAGVLGSITDGATALRETAPGIYTGTWTSTAEEGSYRFEFDVKGQTLAGNDYTRTYSHVLYLPPVPEGRSAIPGLVRVGPIVNRLQTWRAVLEPRTASKRALGPGLADKLSLQSADGRLTLALNDCLDGTYSCEFRYPAGRKPPKLRAIYHARGYAYETQRSKKRSGKPAKPRFAIGRAAAKKRAGKIGRKAPKR